MKNKLILLAKEIGFESKFFGDKAWKHSTKEPMRYLLWMEELKNYLLEKHNTFLSIQSMNSGLANQSSFFWRNNMHNSGLEPTYVKALESSIINIIEIILKNEKNS
jgi:hypothetical protein